MGALFQDKLADWLSVVIYDSDSGIDVSLVPKFQGNNSVAWRSTEDLVRDVAYAIVILILRVQVLITTSEDPVKRFTNPNHVLTPEKRKNIYN
jgi:hypothetical protein